MPENSPTVLTAVRLKKEQIEAIDKAVSLGLFKNRTDAIRSAVDLLLSVLFSSMVSFQTALEVAKKTYNTDSPTPIEIMSVWMLKVSEDTKTDLWTFPLEVMSVFHDEAFFKFAHAYLKNPNDFEELVELLKKFGDPNKLEEIIEKFISLREKEKGETDSEVRPKSALKLGRRPPYEGK